MRSVGLHLRILKDLFEVALRAQELGLSSFQCFLVYQKNKKHIVLTDQQIKEFQIIRQQFNELYIHGTYWINLCGENFNYASRLLKKELEMAKRIGFSHYILHPGSAIGWDDRNKGIDCLVKVLNDITKNEQNITIVLENTAHGGQSIGSDLYDFKIIREKLAFPEKVFFCLDTAHAHAFGYDIISKQGRELFFKLLDETIGFEALSLIHLNDTKEEVGLKRDKHEIIGSGLIGCDSLKQLVTDKRLSAVPIILELPLVSEQEQERILMMVKKWDD